MANTAPNHKPKNPKKNPKNFDAVTSRHMTNLQHLSCPTFHPRLSCKLMKPQPTHLFKRLILLLGLLTLIAALPSCAFKGDLANDAARQNALSSWQPTPVSIRVYPSSKFARVENQLIIEARVELIDEMGDPTKSSGVMLFQLKTTGLVSGSETPKQLYKWDIKLMTLQDQKEAYDPITQAYLFRLKLDQKNAPAVPTTLSVTLVRPQGQRLDAEAILPAVR